jgi:hypothetical protein
LQNHFSVEIAPPARSGLPAALVFFPQRASLARPAGRPPTSRRRRPPIAARGCAAPPGECAPSPAPRRPVTARRLLPFDCSVTALLTRQKGSYGAIDRVYGSARDFCGYQHRHDRQERSLFGFN